MTDIAAGQLHGWAHNIRQAADELFPPHEPPANPSTSELPAGHTAAGHRLVARDNLYSIAAALEQAADS